MWSVFHRRLSICTILLTSFAWYKQSKWFSQANLLISTQMRIVWIFSALLCGQAISDGRGGCWPKGSLNGTGAGGNTWAPQPVLFCSVQFCGDPFHFARLEMILLTIFRSVAPFCCCLKFDMAIKNITSICGLWCDRMGRAYGLWHMAYGTLHSAVVIQFTTVVV